MSFFDEAYLGIPPWDIGRPQKEFVELARVGEIVGKVVDLGCGTGENALYLASIGHPTLGIDSAKRAIDKATEKARLRASTAEFLVADALHLGRLGRKFDTATDSGLFHVFTDPERETYVAGLSEILKDGGRYLMLCFSDLEPKEWGGPRRISKEEIIESFSKGWRVDYIRPAKFESAYHDDGGKAWLSKITKLS